MIEKILNPRLVAEFSLCFRLLIFHSHFASTTLSAVSDNPLVTIAKLSKAITLQFQSSPSSLAHRTKLNRHVERPSRNPTSLGKCAKL
jgi:hypothetical protein